MIQDRVLFGADFHFFILRFKRQGIIQMPINIIIISEALEHMFYSIKNGKYKSFSVPENSFRSFSVA